MRNFVKTLGQRRICRLTSLKILLDFLRQISLLLPQYFKLKNGPRDISTIPGKLLAQ
jgi:hypothetical protein